MGEQLRIRRITAYCMLAVCAMTVLMIVADFTNPVRTPVVLLFVLTVPGWSLISYVNVRHLSVTWISAVGLSLSVCIVLAQFLVLTKFWHPEAALAILACVCVPLLAHHVLRSQLPAVARETPGEPAAGAP
ncbi:DUF1616 domain-containing protein [Amycolatopsis taiwanensis]|uniref:Uncharacterized protein n=1 Tax=Amycolatopsis taiwanensis TaxID=342230 RepID=A0A9W6R5A8_9PSEU|nr:DUF1616 domain-containing protein [Amycolatopsis taiwanensis]GLY68923.1 hypothetical protein Atai01_55420 [Amycolatopsis taiwanensis]